MVEENIFDALVLPIIEALKETVWNLLQAIKRFLNRFHSAVIGVITICCKNKRLAFLALHHPKRRVRKKNLRRLLKPIQSSRRRDDR